MYYDRFPSLLQDDRTLKPEEFCDEGEDFDSDLEELLGSGKIGDRSF